MSSILRSSKFVRCFAGFARSFVINSTKIEIEGSLINSSIRQSTSFIRSLSVQTVNSQSQPSANNLERTIQQLDQDVRRTGRISRRDIEEVLEEIRQTKTATSSQSLLVIRCCGNLVPEELPSVRTKLVQEIWATLEKLKIPMDVSHYNALLRVYLENEHTFSPTEFLTELEKKGVEPNRVTYQRLITRYCQEGDIEGATRILEYMREKNLPVNESVFNALIMGHSQADDMESASGILGVMMQAGLEPSADTYTALLCGYAKLGDMDKIRELLKECDTKDVYLLDKDHMDIIYSLSTNGYTQHVDEILARMKKMTGYNQDAVNLILRLVNSGLEDVSLKILLTMTRQTRNDGTQQTTGNFFIKQLLKANRPVEKILDVCRFLEKEGLNPRAVAVATEASLSSDNLEQISSLLKVLKAEGIPVRQHYFWPLLCTAGKTRDNGESIRSVLSLMINEFNLTPSNETLRDYVIPNYKKRNFDQLITSLKSIGVPVAAVAASVVHELLQHDDLRGAADIASKYRAFYSPNILRKPTVVAFSKKKDTDSFISLLHHIYDGVDRAKLIQDEQNQDLFDKREMVGLYVLEAVKMLGAGNNQIVQGVLQGLLDKGMGISHSTAEKIQNLLCGEELTNEISSLLESLTSNDLTPTAAVKKQVSGNVDFVQLDESTLLTRMKHAQANGLPVLPVKRSLMILYSKQLDGEKAETLFKGEKEDEWTPGVYATIIDLFIKADNVEKALEYFNKLKTVHKENVLSSLKRVRLAVLLVKNERVEEAVEILSQQAEDERDEETYTFTLTSACYQLLNTLAEQGKADELGRMFEMIVNNQIVGVTNVLLGPLVKVHLVRGDVETALSEFERLCNKYKYTPWKNELSCKLIEKEDAKSLQKITDLSTQIHGEVNSLYDLMFSFVQCGRIRQARKILETPGLRNRPQRLTSICERYRQEGSVESLERLVEATKDITHIDRSDIFKNLLLTYITSEDTDKALGLWTQMQDEDVQPSDEFLIKLGELLQRNNLDVPFVIPQVSTTPSEFQQELVQSSTSVSFKNLRTAIRAKDWIKVIYISQSLLSKNVSLSSSDVSFYVEGLCHVGSLEEAVNYVETSFRSNVKVSARNLRFLLNKLAASGNTAAFKRLDPLFSSEEKRLVSFDNRYCHAYQSAGKYEQYLDKLKQELDSCQTPQQLAELEEKFPRGGALGILSSRPELTSKYEMIAQQYYEKGILSPLNVLWQSYFMKPETKDKADKIYKQYLADSPKLMFQKICKEARITGDADLARRLADTLSGSKVNNLGQGIAYSCLIDVLVTQGKPEEALSELKKCIDAVSLECFNTTALTRLKNVLESQGKVFPYTIPQRKGKDLTSSSSDDEETRN